MLQDCKPQLIPISLFLMSLIQMQSLAGNERKTKSNGIFNVLGKDTFLFFFRKSRKPKDSLRHQESLTKGCTPLHMMFIHR